MKQKKEIKVQESDSEPSCDNFDELELAERFIAAVSDDEKEEVIQEAKMKDEALTDAKEKKPKELALKKPVESKLPVQSSKQPGTIQ